MEELSGSDVMEEVHKFLVDGIVFVSLLPFNHK